jgi:ParB family transcriptional regulator, chromosome partitioning protein
MSGLGRGLDALIPGSDFHESGMPNEISVGLIDVNPHQPRTYFDEEKINELATSIKKHGVLQPLIVTPKGDHFELIAGERRLRAAKVAGLLKVPVIVREVPEHEKREVAIIENIHRSDLDPIDEAISYRKLIEEFNYTQEQVSEMVGRSRSLIANKLRILSLPVEIKRAIKEGKITEGHAKALLAVEDEGKRQLLFERIMLEGLNVREVESQAKEVGSRLKKAPSENDLATRQLSDDLKSYLGSKVNIKNTAKGGKIEIVYYSGEELARIYQKIKGIE